MNNQEKETQTIEQLIKDWRRKFKLPVNDDKSFAENLENYTSEQIEMDININIEEFEELKQALLDKDKALVLDGIGDIFHTLWQVLSRLGLTTENVRDVVEEVAKSNMTKNCSNMDEAMYTADWYKENKNVDSTIDDEDLNFILVFQHGDESGVMKDKKLLKNKVEGCFKEPDFTQILKEL